MASKMFTQPISEFFSFLREENKEIKHFVDTIKSEFPTATATIGRGGGCNIYFNDDDNFYMWLCIGDEYSYTGYGIITKNNQGEITSHLSGEISEVNTAVETIKKLLA